MNPLVARVFTDMHLRAEYARIDYPRTLFEAESRLASDILARAICHSSDIYVREKYHPSLIAEFAQ
jgi:uncharacterized protein YijF (DUF1287 family)